MTESKLFVSSCSRREMVRRRNHVGSGALGGLDSHRTLVMLAFVLVSVGAFLAGRGGI
jgi:hypothetical protein